MIERLAPMQVAAITGYKTLQMLKHYAHLTPCLREEDFRSDGKHG